jgi:hypothetical protein
MTTIISAIVTLTNNGPYLTNAQDFVLIVQFKDGRSLTIKSGLLHTATVLPYINGRMEQMNSIDDLNQKAFAPIPIGGEVRGRLLFQDSSIDPAKFNRDLPLYTIEGTDTHQKTFSASIQTEKTWRQHGSIR